MGKLDSLLEALATKLPCDADHRLIAGSLRAAAKGLTEKHSKLKLLLSTSEDRLVKRIQARLRERAALKEAADEEEGAAEEEDAEEASEEEADTAGGIMSGYKDVDEDDPTACLNRALELLTDALTSLRPSERAAQTLEGLLALVGCNTVDGSLLPLEALRVCLRLVPAAVATLGFGLEPPSWRRFLGFLLSAPARLSPRDRKSEDVPGLVDQMARLVALSARQPATARSALHAAISTVACPSPSSPWLPHLAPGVLLLAQRGFAGSQAFAGASLQRSDMVALLLAYRFFGACRAAGAAAKASEAAVSEARSTLRLALERHFDATHLQPELARLAEKGEGVSKSLKRRLAKPVDGRANAAALALEVMDVLPASTAVSALVRLATVSGLPVGEDEQLDQRIAKARAQGSLFFEDVEGVADAGQSGFAGAEALAAAAGAARRRGVEPISGIETLRQPAKGGTKKKKRKAEDAADSEAPRSAESTTATKKAKTPRRA